MNMAFWRHAPGVGGARANRHTSLPATGLLSMLVAAWTGCRTPAGNPPPGPFLPPVQGSIGTPAVHTFSIVAYDPHTGDLGVAVESKFFGVGTVVPWAKAGVGAIATQSYANVAYGQQGLTLLEQGRSARETLQQLTAADERRDWRQVGIVDAHGNCASFTGAKCNEWAGHREGKDYCVQGNLLAGEAVVESMVAAFEKTRQQADSELADWLMAALQAGQAAGGDKRGQQSAALLVVRKHGGYDGVNDRFIDLRVEDHQEPIRELSRLLTIHKQFYASAHQHPSTDAKAKANSSK